MHDPVNVFALKIVLLEFGVSSHATAICHSEVCLSY